MPSVLWYLKNKGFTLKCSITVWKQKLQIARIRIDSLWITKTDCDVLPCTIKYFCFLCIFLAFLFLSSSNYNLLLMLCLKVKSDGEAYFKGQHASGRHLLELAEREAFMCATRLQAKWFLLAGVKLMAVCSSSPSATWRQRRFLLTCCVRYAPQRPHRFPILQLHQTFVSAEITGLHRPSHTTEKQKALIPHSCLRPTCVATTHWSSSATSI